MLVFTKNIQHLSYNVYLHYIALSQSPSQVQDYAPENRPSRHIPPCEIIILQSKKYRLNGNRAHFPLAYNDYLGIVPLKIRVIILDV